MITNTCSCVHNNLLVVNIEGITPTFLVCIELVGGLKGTVGGYFAVLQGK